jgi:hypothetical protein
MLPNSARSVHSLGKTNFQKRKVTVRNLRIWIGDFDRRLHVLPCRRLQQNSQGLHCRGLSGTRGA